MVNLIAYVKSGPEQGIELYPHRHPRRENKFITSPDRFEKNYVVVDSVEELIPYIKRGWGVRMSNPRSMNHRSASLIMSDSLKIID
ncbi:hypothetical protein KO361_03620 [Candidatus Woesearchaeota archaeon]|nr:hypothetical protein [Candidatus Woesearchaeota archaeon]